MSVLLNDGGKQITIVSGGKQGCIPLHLWLRFGVRNPLHS